MDNEFNQGLIVGMALQPLSVAIQGGEPENFCDILALTGVMSNDGYCEKIEF